MSPDQYATLLSRLNADGRSPGGCTPAVCRVYEGGGEVQPWINAICGLEVATKRDDGGTYTRPGRMAGPGDYEAVKARLMGT